MKNEMERGRMEMRDNPNMRGYDRDRRGRFTDEMGMNRTYEYGPRNGMEMEDEMESRFRNNRRSEYRGGMRGMYQVFLLCVLQLRRR